MTQPFPSNNEYSGFNAPMRVECDIGDLVVEGALPKDINGTWFRLTPDPYYPPKFDHDNFFASDGMLSMFRFHDGKVDYKTRYVMTDRLKAERAAGRALFGIYRNPYTDDSSVKDVPRGVANTTPVWHADRLLMLKEDSLPMAMDPATLATLGWWNFDGRIRSETVTAHPRIDFDTGEMFLNGYEAGGLATRDISLMVVNKDGRLVREEWFEAPYVSMMHDFVVTKEHIVFPLFPTTADLDRIKGGGPHWVYEPDKPTWVGIMPRDGSVKDLRWFQGPGVSAYHFMNGYTEGSKVYFDFSYTGGHQFPFVRDDSGQVFEPQKMMCPYVRWEFDLAKPGDQWVEHVLCPAVGDFPRIADRDHMKDYDVGYYVNYQPQNGPPLMTGIAHMGFNTVTRLEVKSGRATHFSLGPGTTVAEPVHVPSRISGHEGYLLVATELHDQWLSDVVVLEAAHIEKGPIARIKLPLRMRHQLHGSWVNAEDLPPAARG
ncbi:MAG: carotenoid oxygenase family protein [Gammaproteobacteria bacterium]|nr:carotenoid oxygenase family protein [Gammaproteobacteria bacterium]